MRLVSLPEGQYKDMLIVYTGVTSAGVDTYSKNISVMARPLQWCTARGPTRRPVWEQVHGATLRHSHDLGAVRGHGTGCPNYPRDDFENHKDRTLGDATYHACHFDMNVEKVLRFVGSDMPRP